MKYNFPDYLDKCSLRSNEFPNHYHWNWQDPNFRKTVLNGVAWTAHLEIPEDGINTDTPSREFLSENISKWGGEQNRKNRSKPAAKVNPNAKALFASPVIANNQTKGRVNRH